MPQKSDQTPSIKDFVTISNKQSGKQKVHDNKSTKQPNKNSSMTKEVGNGTKSNTQKTPKPDKKEQESTTTTKRDASTRSSLDENPGKRQREALKEKNTMEKDETDEKGNESHNDDSNSLNEPANPKELTQSSEEMEYDPTVHSDHNISTETIHHQNTLESLLHELRDLKGTIMKLDTKIDHSYQDLSSKITNTEELKDLITSQNDKITTLYTENKNLKQQNEALERELLEVQDSMLQLKVDITGIRKIVMKLMINYTPK